MLILKHVGVHSCVRNRSVLKQETSLYPATRLLVVFSWDWCYSGNRCVCCPCYRIYEYFLLWNGISIVQIYTIFCLSVHQLTDIWIVTSLGILGIILLWIWHTYKSFRDRLLLCSSGLPWTQYSFQAGLTFTVILLTQPLKFWDYRCAPPFLAFSI